MDEQLMNIMGDLQRATDTFLTKYNMAGFKAHTIRQHLRTAYEWVILGQFSRAQMEIALAEKQMS